MVTTIRIARIKTGLTLRHFAAAHGFAETTLCRIERGQSYVPASWRERLAKSLSVSLDEICDKRGWPRFLDD